MKYRSIIQLVIICGLFLLGSATVSAEVVSDTAFNANVNELIENGGVYYVTVQRDGKILIGGTFTTYDGGAVGRFLRLNADGTPDTTFNTAIGSGFNNSVQWITQLSDNRIAVGGNFTTFNGNTRGTLVVLNEDGTENSDFMTNIGTGVAGSFVGPIKELSDGSLIVAGAISSFNGNARSNIIKLNSDGTEVASFAANAGTFNSFVRDVEVQSDGRLVVSGAFTAYGTGSTNRIARLNADGTEDLTFAANVGTGFNSFVFRSAQDSDGNLYFGGNFTTFNSIAVGYVAKLDEDGNLDSTFTTNIGTGSNDDLLSVAYSTTSDSIYLGGNSSMSLFNGTTTNRIARLSISGELDDDFATDIGDGFNGQMQLVYPFDRHIYVAGTFTTFDGDVFTRFMRLIDLDTTPPTMSITTSAVAPVTGVFTVTFTADENITSFVSSDVSVTNGTVSNFVNTVGSTVWTATITPSATGNVVVTVAAGAFEDDSSNVSTADAQLTIAAEIVEDSDSDEGSSTGRRKSGKRRTSLGGNIIVPTKVDTSSKDGSYEPQACAAYMSKYIKVGADNDAQEVEKLERFLNEYFGEDLEVDGEYSIKDMEAVKRFQASHSDTLSFWGISEPTGYVYISTIKAINRVYCQETLKVSCPYFENYYDVGDSDPEVSRIKMFLNNVENERLDLTNVFDLNLAAAISRFQSKYESSVLTPWGLTAPTGRWYQSTRKKADDLLGCYAPVRLDNGVVLE